MKTRFLHLLFLFLVVACSTPATLNMRERVFGERPRKTVWFQVAGLSEEHLAMLRFNFLDAQKTTAFESADCIGKVWNFNLYELRPDPALGFLAQTLGTPNVKGTCEDTTHDPLWSYIGKIDGQTFVLEHGVEGKNSFENLLSCPGQSSEATDLTLIRMNKAPTSDARSYHYQDKGPNLAPGIIYDRSCSTGSCYASLFSNFKAIWDTVRSNNAESVFIVRDFSYYNALKKQNISAAREILNDLEKAVALAMQDSPNDLVLVTTSAVLPLEFPEKGVSWVEYEKKGKNIVYKRASLMSMVLAKGRLAENFCGVYSESEILKRLLWLPEEKKFGVDTLKKLFQ
jgi:hypothetical protein